MNTGIHFPDESGEGNLISDEGEIWNFLLEVVEDLWCSLSGDGYVKGTVQVTECKV